jgi:hypothetical protein
MSEFKDTVIEIMLREMGRPKKTHEQWKKVSVTWGTIKFP